MDRGPEQVLDEYLVVLSRAGSRAALRQLIERWTPRLVRYIARTLESADDVDDVAQDVWTAALRGLSRLNDPASFPAWIYAIATRKCADAIRARRRHRRLAHGVSAEAAVNGVAHQPAPAGIDLAAALARLPPGQRIAVSLHYGEGLPVDAVALALGIPAGTVKSRLHAARAALKSILEGDPS